MAAHIDHDLLLRLARSPADAEGLEGINRDRHRILAGEQLQSPGELIELSLDLTPVGDPWAVSPRLDLQLRSDLASASLDTFLEIFRDHAHARIPGFRGEDGGTVVDLGANEGYYSLAMLRRNPDIRVLAVEALAEHVALLKANLFRSETTAMVIHAAVVAGADEAAQSGSATLQVYPHVGSITSFDMRAFPRPWVRPERIQTRRVPARSLETILDAAGIDEASLLKADLEGAEAAIFPDSVPVLRRFRRMVVECHGAAARDAVTAAAESAGFRLLHAEGRRSGDCYFERRPSSRAAGYSPAADTSPPPSSG